MAEVAEVLPLAEFGTQRCKKCGRVLPFSEFQKLPGNRLGIRGSCKKCESEKSMQWVDANPDKALNAHLRRRFGITFEQYLILLERQGGLCAICGEPPTVYGTPGGRRRQGRQVKPRLVVDHDHVTGRVRGLLCVTCNRGLGMLKDDPALVRSALEYLGGE